jgi:hypothetical protein
MNEYLKYNKNNQYDKKLSNYNDELVLELWDVNEIRNDVRFYKGFSNEKYDTKKCITDIEVQIVKRLKEVCENNEIPEKCVPKVKRCVNDGTGGDDDSKRKVRRFLKRRSQPRKPLYLSKTWIPVITKSKSRQSLTARSIRIRIGLFSPSKEKQNPV